MLNEFLKYIESNNLASSNEKILLAVSGGIDSMVMAELFRHSPYITGIAHCNFKLRGVDSDADELHVKEYASKMGIPLFVKSFDTENYARQKGISIQMAARQLRYDWFEEIRIKNRYDLIAVAHNMDDRTETFLINLTRGTGISGLVSMRPRKGHIIRPLLFASRNSIENYAISNHITWREDKSNDETKYIRNKFRHNIIPLFKEINPDFDKTIIETAERFSELEEILRSFIAAIKEKTCRQKGDLISFDSEKLQSCRPLKTTLFELFRPYGLTTGQLNDLIELLKGRTGAKILTRTHMIIRNRNELIVTTLPIPEPEEYVTENIEELRMLPFIERAEIIEKGPDFVIDTSPLILSFDAEKISFPMKIRRWKAGDRFQPLGMNEFKKLSDFFTDRKYSIRDKERAYILESGGDIAAILGERIDNRFRITTGTRKVLLVVIKPLFKY
ncbi:MAG TPA: tRNA lysidine(34) synthetase TilS [Bacteroidales bacterium]|nr:tRNA lysidine(34) synthetase TilS [Bacteroidales bacterium]HQG35716.1 tRNA lysidine(34) synthetase TilS [Bacteroidales bacterium]HQG53363.1 tRNA lysidine(34) synthetase TilS [Bacteroidales bacterium]HQJ19770.1 tRNA lysidine(34) synthetase TilS [Bacteroidales bacterium]